MKRHGMQHVREPLSRVIAELLRKAVQHEAERNLSKTESIQQASKQKRGDEE
ncbi:hypothetical protein D3C76_874300 [compost metagenome]